jgi:glycerol-3-phosphate dehydrogenase (NAD(P)+)
MTGISVIGAGAWGTALAQLIASKGTPVTLYARHKTLADEINTKHTNKAYLPDIKLNRDITATDDLAQAARANILLIVTPAQALRATLELLKPSIRPDHILVLCAKGIEISSGKMLSDVADEILPQTPIAILSGPNFAHEIGMLKPAATTLACADAQIAQTLQNAIAAPSFRPYVTTDIIGVQIAGALKNVIAIACGMAEGLNMGESARASLVTRGMAEIVRLGLKMGAKPETFLGLSGMGDLMLTCSSVKSRNFSLGLQLGQGLAMAQIMAERKAVTEGVHTAKAAAALSKQYVVDMPVCIAVDRCVNEGLSLSIALREILSRPLGREAVS